MYNGKCNGCGSIADIIRRSNVCADCTMDQHETNAAAVRLASFAKRETRIFANKKRRAGGSN